MHAIVHSFTIHRPFRRPWRGNARITAPEGSEGCARPPDVAIALDAGIGGVKKDMPAKSVEVGGMKGFHTHALRAAVKAMAF